MKIWLSRLGTAVLSLVLAMLVWVVAVQEEYPRQRFGQPITVSRSGLPENLVVFGDVLNEVRIEVRAPKARWPNLQARDFTAWIDLSGLSAGEYDVPVRVLPPDPQVQVTAVDPPLVRVRLEERKEKSIPVQVNIMDAPAFGYTWGTPVITPTQVTVSGASAWVDQVAAVSVDFYFGGARSNVERTLQVKARDAAGIVVGFVSVIPRDVKVTAPVFPLPGYRELTVLVEPIGTPAEGYTIGSVAAEPKLVTVQGDPAVITALSGYITVPVNINGANQDVVERVPLRLPENISALGTTTVEVNVRLVPISGVQTVRQQPVIQGLGPGLTYTMTLDAVTVFLSGPLPRLLALKPDSVLVVLDVTGRGPGVHLIEPLVAAPTELKVDSVSPQTVEITIGLLPTLTPTPTGPLSPVWNGTPAGAPSLVGPGPAGPTGTPVPRPQP
ncbi:MAG: CdaR family protein [Anaerolineae bacterium]